MSVLRRIAPLVLLLVAACGGPTTQAGDVEWDAGTAVIEVTGRGAYTLDLDNNGTVAVDRDDGEGTASRLFEVGASLRVRGSGPTVHRFRLRTPGEARIDYRLEGPACVHVDSRVD